jgi:hypothetical protein
MRKTTRWNPLETARAGWSLAHNWRAVVVRRGALNRECVVVPLRALQANQERQRSLLLWTRTSSPIARQLPPERVEHAARLPRHQGRGGG